MKVYLQNSHLKYKDSVLNFIGFKMIPFEGKTDLYLNKYRRYDDDKMIILYSKRDGILQNIDDSVIDNYFTYICDTESVDD
jgi:hypothetical protein